MSDVVERVVTYMYEHYDQPISLADMADVAILSQFHFARRFRDVTGVSPGRFLSAIRLQRAKSLLLTTSLTVTDISYMVGYNSLGTFTSRFTKSVGLSPVRFRRLSGGGSTPVPTGCAPGQWMRRGTIAGWTNLPATETPMKVYLGVFDGPIAQGMPVTCGVVDDVRSYRLAGVPEGEWYVFGVGVEAAQHDGGQLGHGGARVARLVAREGPVKVGGGERVWLGLDMRRVRPTDPPMLLALPNINGCGPQQMVAVPH